MRIPSFRALYAFTLVVKTESTNQAAKQLGISSSAVSHLLSSLEKTLDCQLLDRRKKRFNLTSEGHRLSSGLMSSFANIETVLESFQPAKRWELRITIFPSLASQWLIPKLSLFCDQEPNIDILLSTTSRSVDLTKESYDFAFRWGKGDWPDMDSTKLWDESLACVLSPSLLGKLQDDSIKSLLKLPRLHVSAFRNHWAEWLSAAYKEYPASHKGKGGVKNNISDGTVIETRSFVIQAAVAGLGAAVIDPQLVKKELEAGLLIEPYPCRVPLSSGIWLVRNPSKSITRHGELFCKWALEESIT